MTTPVDTIKTAILGNPVDPNKQPSRTGVVNAFAEMQAQLEAAQAGALVFSTVTALNASGAVPSANIMAWVMSGSGAGIYQNTGTAGTPVWTRRGDLPQFCITGLNVGAGSANAIQVTTDLPVPLQAGRALIVIPILETNTASPVTVSINSGSPLTILTNSGNDVAVGGLPAESYIAGFISNSTFRLLSDQASAAISAAAEDFANDAAAAAAAAAASYASIVAALAPTVNIKLNATLVAGQRDYPLTGLVPVGAPAMAYVYVGNGAWLIPKQGSDANDYDIIAGGTYNTLRLTNTPTAEDAGTKILVRGAFAATTIALDGDTSDAIANASDVPGITVTDALNTINDRTDNLIYTPKLVQKKLMEPFFGFNNGTVDTQIFSSASSAVQGIASYFSGGVEKLIATQRPVGSAWSAGERCRIAQFTLAEDGSIVSHDWFTGLLNIGHGSGAAVFREGSDDVLYTTIPNPAGGGAASGKGFSKIILNGASTSSITSYQLWGNAGSGHRYQNYNRATIAISPNKRFLAMVDTKSDTERRTVFVYDFAAVLALADALDANPLAKFDLPSIGAENAFSCQGLAIDNDGNVYALRGASDAFGYNEIGIFDLGGTPRRRIPIDQARAQYGLAGILNHPTLGNNARFEVEGLGWRSNGDLMLSITETWKAGAKIVSYNGENWAAAALSGPTTGVPPSNGGSWVRTTKATTDGAWDAAIDYGFGTNTSLDKKTVYAVRVPLGEAGEEPTDTGLMDQAALSDLYAGEGDSAGMAWRWRNSLTFKPYSERLRKWFNGFWYDSSSRIRIYDAVEGNDNSVFGSIQALFSASFRGTQFRGRGTTAAEGAVLRILSSDDPSNPHGMTFITGPSGSIRGTIDTNGRVTFAADSGNTPLTLRRGDDGPILAFEKSAGTALFRIIRGSGSPEGSIVGNITDVYFNSSGGASTTMYVKTNNSGGNTGWTAK